MPRAAFGPLALLLTLLFAVGCGGSTLSGAVPFHKLNAHVQSGVIWAVGESADEASWGERLPKHPGGGVNFSKLHVDPENLERLEDLWARYATWNHEVSVREAEDAAAAVADARAVEAVASARDTRAKLLSQMVRLFRWQ